MLIATPPGCRRADLRAAGWSDSAIQRALRAGHLRRVAFDTYVAAGQEVPDLGYLLAGADRVPVLSHRSAARAWALPVAASPVVELTVPRGCARRGLPAGVRLHQSELGQQWELLDGVRVTSVERTLVDLARTEPLEVAVTAIDSALHSGATTVAALDRLLAEHRRWPGIRRCARAIGASDGRAESPLESMARLVLVAGGVPPPDLQRAVPGVGRVDFWYDGVVVEADGFAYHSDRDSFREDRRRSNACAAAGLLVLRFTWEDVHLRPAAVVATVRAALRCAALRG